MEGSLADVVWSFCYLSVLIGLSCYGLHRYFIVYLFLKNRLRVPQPVSHFEQLPVITVQLPLFNEIYVVERLLKSVSELDYPRERLQIQVLDDSTDETRYLAASCAQKLAERGFDIELIHRTDRVGYKAGALEAGLATARGDFVCILDADFVPQRALLRSAVHFFTDPNIGMIQTRWGHINRGYSLLTRVQAMFLDGHLLLEQVARSRSGRFFNFNGTAGLWRKSCIAESGGEALIARRQAFLAGRRRSRLTAPVPQPALVAIAPAVAACIAFLRSRAGGAWQISATGLGDFYFESARVDGDEIIARAAARGFVPE